MTEEFTVESSLSRLARTTLADQVYSDIKELIFSGKISPEERLTLRRLAAAVGTSPMPVRDAVSRLVAEKALELLPNRSIRVSWPSRARFEEIVTIRCTVEGLASEQASGRRTEAELVEIQKQAKLFERFANAPEPDATKAMRANRLMHFAIYRAAGMPTLVRIIEELWLQVGPVFWAIVSNEINAHRVSDARGNAASGNQLLDITFRSHAALVDAIANRDGPAARRAVIDDIKKASKIMLRLGRFSAGED